MGGAGDPPADVHGGHALPAVGLGVEALHGVEAAGAVVAPGDVQQALQHRHASAAAAAQHVGDGRPHVALLGQSQRREHRAAVRGRCG